MLDSPPQACGDPLCGRPRHRRRTPSPPQAECDPWANRGAPHSDPFKPLPSHTGPVQDRYHHGRSGVQLPAYFTESPDSPVRYTPTRSRTPSMTSRRTRSRSRSPSVKRSRSPPARERGPQPPDRSRGYHHDRGPPAPDRDRERATSRHEPRTQYHSQDAPPRYSPPRQEERSAGGPNPRGQAPGKGGPS